MQVAFIGFWELVLSLTLFLQTLIWQKCFIVASFGSTLKSPVRIKFSYCPGCKSRLLPIKCKWLAVKFSLDMQELQRSHFFFLNFIQRKILLTSQKLVTLKGFVLLHIPECHHHLHFCPICMGLDNLLSEIVWKEKTNKFLFEKSKAYQNMFITCCRESNISRRKFMLSCANIKLLMFLWRVFSMASCGSRRISPFRFAGILCGSSEIGSSVADLWPELLRIDHHYYRRYMNHTARKIHKHFQQILLFQIYLNEPYFRSNAFQYYLLMEKPLGRYFQVQSPYYQATQRNQKTPISASSRWQVKSEKAKTGWAQTLITATTNVYCQASLNWSNNKIRFSFN